MCASVDVESLVVSSCLSVKRTEWRTWIGWKREIVCQPKKKKGFCVHYHFCPLERNHFKAAVIFLCLLIWQLDLRSGSGGSQLMQVPHRQEYIKNVFWRRSLFHFLWHIAELLSCSIAAAVLTLSFCVRCTMKRISHAFSQAHKRKWGTKFRRTAWCFGRKSLLLFLSFWPSIRLNQLSCFSFSPENDD